MTPDATLDRLLQLAEENKRDTDDLRQRVDAITELTPEQLGGTSVAKTIDSYERRLSPWRKVWAVIAAIGSFCALVFGAGMTYQQIKGGLATKADISEHKTQYLDPVVKDVETIKQDLKPVKDGIDSLVESQERERELKKLKAELERHDKEYNEAMQEYTADKAANVRAGSRPRKTEAHLNLEARVKEMEELL